MIGTNCRPWVAIVGQNFCQRRAYIRSVMPSYILVSIVLKVSDQGY